MAAMIFKLPPQFGQWSMSISKTRLSSLAQLMRAGAPCACFPWCLLLSWVLSKGQCSIWRSLEHLRLVRFKIPHGFARFPTEPLLELLPEISFSMQGFRVGS